MSTEAITLAESKRLVQLEKQITESVFAAGEALKEIRDKKLYRADYSTFEEYCREKWGFTRQRGYQLIDAFEVVEALPEKCKQIVDTESQARALSSIPPRSRPAVLNKIQQANKPVTAKSIAAHAPPVKSKPPVASKAEPVVVHRVLDAVGRVIPDALLPLWERSHEITELVNLLQRVKNVLSAAEKEDDPLFRDLNFQRTLDGIANSLAELKGIKPYSLCVKCHGKMPETCTACLHVGIIGEFKWKHKTTEEDKAMILKTVNK